MQNITLTTTISGKEFIISTFLARINRLLKSNPSMRWLACDTSGNESIKKLIHDCAECANCEFAYTTFRRGPKYDDYAKRVVFWPLLEYMPKLYTHVMSQVPECDFVLNIEDDVVLARTDPVPALLKGFDANTAAVVGVTFNRRLTPRFGVLQGSLRQTRKSGYSEIKRTAFGLIMIKFEYSQLPFGSSFGNEIGFDNVFGAMVESYGKTMKMAWNVRAKHYFKNDRGVVSHVG